MGFLYNNERDIYDNQRFYDPCDEQRTENQILWEEGIYKKGSFKYLWAYNFGKNDLSKLGRKASSFLITIIFWVALNILIPNDIIRTILQCLSVSLIAFAEMYSFRGKKGLTKLNIVYVVIVGLLAFVCYKYFNFVFWQIGYAAVLSAYSFLYTIIENIAYIVRIGITAFTVYYILKYESETFYEKAGAVVFVISAVMGILFRYVPLLKLFIALGIVIYILAFVIYTKSKNIFTKNLTYALAFWSLIEIIGYNAVISGAMENFIENAIW